jgi:hypothetical protein
MVSDTGDWGGWQALEERGRAPLKRRRRRRRWWRRRPACGRRRHRTRCSSTRGGFTLRKGMMSAEDQDDFVRGVLCLDSYREKKRWNGLLTLGQRPPSLPRHRFLPTRIRTLGRDPQQQERPTHSFQQRAPCWQVQLQLQEGSPGSELRARRLLEPSHQRSQEGARSA